MIQARRVGHVTLSTPDLARQVEYYTQVLGLAAVERTATRAVLATKVGHEAVVLEHGADNACTALSLQVSPQTSLQDAERAMRQQGIACEIRSDVTPGIARA